MLTDLAVVRLDRELPLPSRAHDGDAGVDLYSADDVELMPGQRALVSTGIAVAIPHGMVGLIHPRSGLAARVGLSIVNSPGTIDAGYRGEIKVALINLDPAEPIVIRRGDRIAQLLPSADAVIDWFRDLKAYALKQAEKGTTVPGYKLVEGRSVRQWSNEDAATEALEKLLGEAAYIVKLISPTQAEKALGRAKADEIADFVIKPRGKPSLAPEHDPRPSFGESAVDLFN